MTETVYALEFGIHQTATPFQRSGFSGPEGEFCWMEGVESTMALPGPVAPGLHALAFELWPISPGQRLTVIVNGVACAERTIHEETAVTATIAVQDHRSFPRLHVVLKHPDAVSPRALHGGAVQDSRMLSLAVRRVRLIRLCPGERWSLPPLSQAEVEGLWRHDLKALMLEFQSLGHNCEFGLAQRRCGAEPLNLFRFARVGLPALIRGLRRKFPDFGTPETITLYLEEDHDDHMIKETSLPFIYHTFIPKAQSTEKIMAQEKLRLSVYKEKFLDDWETGAKVYVFQTTLHVTLEDVLPLYLELNESKPIRFLWVRQSDQHPSGMVERLGPNLLVGFIARLAPLEDAGALDLSAWLSICANTIRLSPPRAVAPPA